MTTSIAPGSRLGPYEIIAPLGAGGMGEVYRARDTKLDRDVAIKVLPPAFATDGDRLSRFTREAKTLAALNHPNVAQIYGIEGSALVMELVEGEDLSIVIARHAGSKDPAYVRDTVLPIAKQIADALEAAHELGIVHRDLKPANIKVRADGTVKVLDFGLAKAMDPAGGSSVEAMNSPTLTAHATQMGMIIGTAAYMAPEQARGKSVDKRADVWAFGVVVYEMLAGRRAFAGEEISDVLAAVLRQDIDWTALPANTPARLRRLLERCLDRDVKQRLRDIGEARVEIAKIEGGAPDSVTGVVSAAVPRGSAWRRALPWAIAGVATIAAIVLAITSLSKESDAGALVRFTVAPPFGATRPAGQGFAVSPNGQSLAFSAISADGVTRIFTRRFDQSETLVVAGTENGALPFWSPGGEALGFSKEGGLYRTDLRGGTPLRLCDIPGTNEGPMFSKSAATWGTRGVIVFASPAAGLFQVPEGGGTPASLTSINTAAGEDFHRWPSFLPDGRHVLFLAIEKSRTRGVIDAVSMDDGRRTRLTESSGGAAYGGGMLLTTTTAPRVLVAQEFDPIHLILSGTAQPVRDQLVLADTNGRAGFSVSSNGTLIADRPPPRTHHLTWLDRLGRIVGRVGPAARIFDFALAPDERRVVADFTDPNSSKNDLWLFDGQREAGTRLTFQLDTRRPIFAHDGLSVLFRTMPDHHHWTLPLGGGIARETSASGEFASVEDFTRDGRYQVLTSTVPSRTWLREVGANAKTRLLVESEMDAAMGRVSPDGRWLAYSLSLPSGPEVFVQPFDRPGRRQQVSTAGGIGPVWRADGRELFYEAPGQVMAAPASERGGELSVGTPQRLFAIHTQGFVGNQPHNFEVAANGQKFLVNTIVGDSGNAVLEVTLNWKKGLPK